MIELQTHKNIKNNVELVCTFVKTTNDNMDRDDDDDDGGGGGEGQVIRDLKSFNTKNVSTRKCSGLLNISQRHYPLHFQENGKIPRA